MQDHDALRVSRRTLVKTGAAAGAAAAVAAPLARGVGAAPHALPAAQDIKDVPRERTLILRWAGEAGRYVDQNLWNGYLVLSNHQNGLGLLHEPLAFYSAFADETIPWLAESLEYNEDYTTLNIKTRSGITWSDGTPFTAEDVAYSIRTAGELGAEVKWGVDVSTFLESAVAETDTDVLLTFKIPAPRFMYFMTYKYDIGFYIVPKHIFEGQDWTTFENFDIAAGLPVTTGPWQVVLTSAEQKIIDRRDSWWAVDQGLVAAMPTVERIIYLPAVPDEQMAQQLISNEVDCSLDLRPLTIETVMAENPSIITHTGTEPPFGYVDWWPTSLYVNNERPPFDDPAVRWALSYYIDRDQIIDVALGGAGTKWPLPLPSYPGLQPFVDAAAALLEEYPTLEFNPEKGDAMLDGRRLGQGRRHVDEGRSGHQRPDRVLPGHGRHRPGDRRAVEEPGDRGVVRPAAGLLHALRPWGLDRLALRPRRQRRQRPVRHAVPVPIEVCRGSGWPRRELLPLE